MVQKSLFFVFLVEFSGYSFYLRFFPTDQIFIEMVGIAILAGIIGRIHVDDVGMQCSSQRVAVFLVNCYIVIASSVY